MYLLFSIIHIKKKLKEEITVENECFLSLKLEIGLYIMCNSLRNETNTRIENGDFPINSCLLRRF